MRLESFKLTVVITDVLFISNKRNYDTRIKLKFLFDVDYIEFSPYI